MMLSMTSLKAVDAKEIASSITAILNENLKTNKEANAGKKKVLAQIDLVSKNDIGLATEALKDPNLTIGVLVAIIVVISSVFFKIIFGGKKKHVNTKYTTLSCCRGLKPWQGMFEEMKAYRRQDGCLVLSRPEQNAMCMFDQLVYYINSYRSSHVN